MLKLIKNDFDYELALKELRKLIQKDPQSGTEDAERLEILGLFIAQYEQTHFPIEKPDPIEAIKFRMEQQGLTNADLVRFIGKPERVTDVLNRKRPLSLKMIRAIHAGLGIPADILIQKIAKPLKSASQAS